MIYIEDIIEELKKEGYENKSIDYAEFTKLYEKYQKYYSDKEFAKILGIEYYNYHRLKSGKGNTRILKEKVNEVSEKRRKEIVEELKKEIVKELSNKGYKGKSISYEKFKELYEPCKKEITEKEFAKILGIKDFNYHNLKSGRQNARILKEKAKGVTEKRRKEIVEELIKKGYKGKSISYEQFKELYEPYKKEMLDKEFAEILGIGYSNYRNLKFGRQNARILKTVISEMKYKIENGNEEYTKRY